MQSGKSKRQSVNFISISDYMYILVMNALTMKGDKYRKWKFMRDHVYSKPSSFRYAKAVISSASGYDEPEMFLNIVENLHRVGALTDRKYKELLHIVKIKYGIIEEDDIEVAR